MRNIIEVKDLHKSFKEIKAVNGISFKVKEGEFFSFLGLNGAGKSTTINILCGDLQKDLGQVFINGVDIENNLSDIKQILGVVYQNSILDKVLTVKENLEYRGALYNLNKQQMEERFNELDQLLNIKEIFNRPVGKLSGGQKRRSDIARALLHKPKILILDEPTTGLDPQTRQIVWNAINKLRQQENVTVFLTTHYMEEVENADYIVILDNGEVVAEGTPLQLKNKYTGDFIRIYNIDEEAVKKMNVNYIKNSKCFVIEVKNSQEATQLITKHPEIFVDYEVIKGKMDDVFLSATGKNLMQEGV